MWALCCSHSQAGAQCHIMLQPLWNRSSVSHYVLPPQCGSCVTLRSVIPMQELSDTMFCHSSAGTQYHTMFCHSNAGAEWHIMLCHSSVGAQWHSHSNAAVVLCCTIYSPVTTTNVFIVWTDLTHAEMRDFLKVPDARFEVFTAVKIQV